MSYLTKSCSTLLGVASLFAVRSADPVDLVRQGNAALEQGNTTTALDFYGQAETRTTDPGLVAFNQATALYQIGHYREAEALYRRSREDAEGPRRARLLYNLGNCILQQARATDARRLREAVLAYQDCLKQREAESSVLEDARYNLELGKLLLLKAKANRDGSDPPNEDPNSDPPPTEDKKEDSRSGAENLHGAVPDNQGKPERVAEGGNEASAAAGKTDQQPPPGKGNLQPIPDDDDLVPLSAEDAAQHLHQAANRIERERQKYLQRPMPAAPAHVKDW